MSTPIRDTIACNAAPHPGEQMQPQLSYTARGDER